VVSTTGDRSLDRPADDGEGRMPLVEHIRELRSRVIKASLAVLAGAAVAFAFYEPIIGALITPVCPEGLKASGGSCPLAVVDILGPLSLQLKVALFGGLALSTPFWLYQLWAFLAPGLHRNERRWTYAFVAVGAPLFLGGAAVSYVLLPIAVKFLLGLTPGELDNLVPVDHYLSFVLRMLFVFGLAFELPLILVVANLAGLLSGRRIATWWRGMVLGIFVFAAVATPTGDPLTMSALALPVCLLYAVAVGITLTVDRRRQRREAPSPEADDVL
jgi:sec-independent protein translocase protein TatC